MQLIDGIANNVNRFGESVMWTSNSSASWKECGDAANI